MLIWDEIKIQNLLKRLGSEDITNVLNVNIVYRFNLFDVYNKH